MFTYIDINSVDNSSFTIKNFKKIKAKNAPSRARKIIQKGDVIYSSVRPYLKNIAIVPEMDNPIASTGFCIIKASENLINKYIFYYFQSDIFLDTVKPFQKGASYPAINNNIFNNLPFPLPPLKEQDRIVQKIEFCFEKAEFIEKKLGETENLIENYRKSLLAKAFRGELVPQDPDDEPASVLLDKIRKEREKNQKGKKRKQDFAPISDDEKPFDILRNWVWVKLGNIVIPV